MRRYPASLGWRWSPESADGRSRLGWSGSRRLALLAVVLRAAERWERGAVNLESPRVDAVDDFAVRGNESLCDGGCCPVLPRAADVVDTFEQNHPARPLQCQHVTVQARQ